MRTPIGLKFGTLKGPITADLSTKFGRNPINIHRIMTDYLRKTNLFKTHLDRFYYDYQYDIV